MPWYLVYRGHRTGPYDEHQLRNLEDGGHLLPGTLCHDAAGRWVSLDDLLAIRPPPAEGLMGMHSFVMLRGAVTNLNFLGVWIGGSALLLVTGLAKTLGELVDQDMIVMATLPPFLLAAATSGLIRWFLNKVLSVKCPRCRGRARAERQGRQQAFRCEDCGRLEVTWYKAWGSR